jgi:hypothetical protein
VVRVAGTIALLTLLGSLSAARASSPALTDRVWYVPNPGTVDLLRMFEHPEEWTRARQLINVFQFTQQHTFTSDAIIGPNTYQALVRVDAFRKLTRWGKKTALGVGAVKEFYCTADASGMNAAIDGTLKAVAAVKAAGGAVYYLAMDEPFVSGRSKTCGGPALEPTADRLRTYMTAVQSALPRVRIGLIEAYPFSSADDIERMLDLMVARGVSPAFLRMDVDWHALHEGEFQRDMRRLQASAHSRGLAFGIIITGYNGNADPLFAVDAYGIANLMLATFPDWKSMPDQIILDSWVQSSSGLNITPSNLPEDRAYSGTNLLLNLYRRLRGHYAGA